MMDRLKFFKDDSSIKVLNMSGVVIGFIHFCATWNKYGIEFKNNAFMSVGQLEHVLIKLRELNKK